MLFKTMVDREIVRRRLERLGFPGHSNFEATGKVGGKNKAEKREKEIESGGRSVVKDKTDVTTTATDEVCFREMLVWLEKWIIRVREPKDRHAIGNSKDSLERVSLFAYTLEHSF